MTKCDIGGNKFIKMFPSLPCQVVRYKEAVLWYERLGMLGGIMGMLLGISIITGLDFLFFVFDYLYVGWKEWWSPTRKQPSVE